VRAVGTLHLIIPTFTAKRKLLLLLGCERRRFRDEVVVRFSTEFQLANPTITMTAALGGVI
jgi:hypothetical protein